MAPQWVELMRLSPGTRLEQHWHTGEVHALTLAGERRLDDGRIARGSSCRPCNPHRAMW